MNIFIRIIIYTLAFFVGYLFGQGLANATEGARAEGPSGVIRVAFIDTGFNPKHDYGVKVPICKEGHYDFNTKKNGVPSDYIGHGTAMAAITTKIAGETGWCAMIININTFFGMRPQIVNRAIIKSVNNEAKAINMSFEGINYSRLEHQALRYANTKKIRMFVAAGNHSINLNRKCGTYPACYRNIPRMMVLGALNPHGHTATYSNYGRFLTWYPGSMFGMHGTSVSTAYATGMYIRYLLEKE